MATQNAVGEYIYKGVYRYTVSGLGSADVSSPMDVGNATERTIQVQGVFTNAVCAVQGRTATDANWAPVNTPSGVAITFTSTTSSIVKIQEHVMQVRTVNTTTVSVASDALTTNLKVTLTLRSDR